MHEDVFPQNAYVFIVRPALELISIYSVTRT